MIKRDCMDSTVQTSYCQGGYSHTEEEQAGPRNPQLPLPIGLQLQYWSVTRISYYKPARHLLLSPHYPSASALHTDVMQPTGIVLEILGFTQVRGAQGPPSGPQGPIGPSQPYTPPICGYSIGTLLVDILMTMFNINCMFKTSGPPVEFDCKTFDQDVTPLVSPRANITEPGIEFLPVLLTRC